MHSAGFEDWDGAPALSETVSRYKVIEHQGRRIVVSYSDRRARKDRRNRTQVIARLHKKLEKSRKPAGVVNRGYAHFLEFPADGRIRINPHKVAEVARWMSCGRSLPTAMNIF